VDGGLFGLTTGTDSGASVVPLERICALSMKPAAELPSPSKRTVAPEFNARDSS